MDCWRQTSIAILDQFVSKFGLGKNVCFLVANAEQQIYRRLERLESVSKVAVYFLSPYVHFSDSESDCLLFSGRPELTRLLAWLEKTVSSPIRGESFLEEIDGILHHSEPWQVRYCKEFIWCLRGIRHNIEITPDGILKRLDEFEDRNPSSYVADWLAAFKEAVNKTYTGKILDFFQHLGKGLDRWNQELIQMVQRIDPNLMKTFWEK
jgi:hypothetical protein